VRRRCLVCLLVPRGRSSRRRRAVVVVSIVVVLAGAVSVAVGVIMAAVAITSPGSRRTSATTSVVRVLVAGSPWRGPAGRSSLPWLRIAVAVVVVAAAGTGLDLSRSGSAAAEFLHELLWSGVSTNGTKINR
jgi:hypothetical protein